MIKHTLWSFFNILSGFLLLVEPTNLFGMAGDLKKLRVGLGAILVALHQAQKQKLSEINHLLN